eukprot:648446-Hanusia_phi.AAC.1
MSSATLLFLLIQLGLDSCFGAQFLLKQIYQSNPLAGASNDLTVLLSVDAMMYAQNSSTITISGLSGAEASNPLTLSGNASSIFSPTWFALNETLELSLSGETLLSDVTYEVSFSIRNPLSSQSSPTIVIQASGTYDINPVNMDSLSIDAFGVSSGGSALYIVEATFNLKEIWQGTPVPDKLNVITVSLQVNCNLPQNSKLTIQGLIATQTADNSVLSIQSTGDAFGTSAVWTKTDGQLVLTRADNYIYSGYFFSFSLTNPSNEQASPAISMSATIECGVYDAAISLQKMIFPNTQLYGVSNGSNPLYIVHPSFTIKSIRQSSPIAGASNMITISLSLNYDIYLNSAVTISGLVDSRTEGNTLYVASNYRLLTAQTSWTQSTGEVKVYMNETVLAEDTVSLYFTLLNPEIEQSSPNIFLSLVINEDSIQIATISATSMDKPGGVHLGIENGTDPLNVKYNQLYMNPENIALSSSAILTIYGSQTGFDSITPASRLHPTACEMTNWNSDTIITCQAPHGWGKSNAIVLSIGKNALQATITDVVTYNSPTIQINQHESQTDSLANKANLASTGNTNIQITGDYFANRDPTITMKLANTHTEASFWKSETAI